MNRVMATVGPLFLMFCLDINWNSYVFIFTVELLSLFTGFMSQATSFITCLLTVAPSAATPIHRIPNELLLEIFTMNATDKSYHLPLMHIKTVIACSQVCCRWRCLSLTSPGIWAQCLDFAMSDEWTQAVLERSGTSRLKIAIPSHSRRPGGHCLIYQEDLIPSIFARCEKLDLQLPYKDWVPAFRKTEQYLPHIEEIDFTCHGPDHVSGFFMDVSVPWAVKTLYLEGVMLPLYMPGLFPFLESLTIMHVTKNLKLTCAGWLKVLENMPQLKTLYLREAFTSSLDPSDHCYSIARSSSVLVSLPNLRDLDCNIEEIDLLNSFFRNIDVSSCCRLAVKTCLPNLGIDFEILCNYLQQFTLNPTFDQSKIHSIFISFFNGTVLTLFIREAPSTQKPDPPALISIELRWRICVCHYKLLSDLLRALDVACSSAKEVDMDIVFANNSALVDTVSLILAVKRAIPKLGLLNPASSNTPEKTERTESGRSKSPTITSDFLKSNEMRMKFAYRR